MLTFDNVVYGFFRHVTSRLHNGRFLESTVALSPVPVLRTVPEKNRSKS